MTPREYLSTEFKEEEFLSNPKLEHNEIISVKTCMKLMELYHNHEINRILNEVKG